MPLSIFTETTDSFETQIRLPVPGVMDIYKPYIFILFGKSRWLPEEKAV